MQLILLSENITTQTPEELKREIQETRAEIKILRAKIEQKGLWVTADDLEALKDARENLWFLRELLESL